MTTERPARARRIRLAIGGLVAVGACWAAALAVRGLHGVPGLEVDAAWHRFVHAHRTPPLVAGSQVLAELGGAPGSIVLAGALAALLLWRRGPRAAIAFVVAAALDEALVTAMKFADQRPGPSGAVFDDRGSFPSGHTAYAAVIAVVLLAVARRPGTRAALVAVVPLMALSRTVLDAHWLTDTVAGAACGAGTAALVLAVAGPVSAAGSPRGARRRPGSRRPPS